MPLILIFDGAIDFRGMNIWWTNLPTLKLLVTSFRGRYLFSANFQNFQQIENEETTRHAEMLKKLLGKRFWFDSLMTVISIILIRFIY
jgi:hypothetical protein